MNRLIERLRAHVDRLGRAGIAGIALLAFAAAFYGSAIAPLSAELAAVRAEARRIQDELRMGGKLGRNVKATTNEQLAAFYGFFPRQETSPEWLGKIYAAAKDKGIMLRSGEYRLDRRADQRLTRYQITLPVIGTYGQIRAFIGTVLAEVPAAALEEITLRRESVSNPEVEAKIRFTLFLGSA